MNKTIIPIANVVGSGEILNLSDFAEFVRYIPLATNDSVLLGNIEGVIYERNHIFLYDFQSRQCRLFSKDGRHISEVGKIGQGPGEYTWISAMSFVPETGGVLLSDPIGYLLFDSTGCFIRRLPPIESVEKYRILTTVAITDELFFSHLTAENEFRYRALVWGKRDTNQVYKLRASYCKWGMDQSTGIVSTFKWRFQDQIRSYWGDNDTIFTISPSDLEMREAFVVDWGQYKKPLGVLLGESKSNGSYIDFYYPGFIESSDYLFMQFAFGKYAPERFTEMRPSPRGGMRKVTEERVFGLFDKRTGELTLLNQPVKHKYLGFRNDLDGGPCFWPKYISSEDEMVTWWMADEFLKIYESLPNPSAELRAVAEKLQPDDNPVLMVVQLK